MLDDYTTRYGAGTENVNAARREVEAIGARLHGFRDDGLP